MAKTEIRIFLGAPSADTAEACAQVVEIVREINAARPDDELADLRLCWWKERPVVCSADHNPQLDVIDQVGDPGECDLVIGLFRHTMGGTLPEPRFGRSGRGRPWHCTEWEIAQGLRGKRAGKVADVWVYRDTSPPTNWTDSRRLQEISGVNEYFDSFTGADGAIAQGINTYEGVEDLARQLRLTLPRWLYTLVRARQPGNARHADAAGGSTATEVLTCAQQALLDTLLRAGTDNAALSNFARDQLMAVLSEPVKGLRGYLLQRYVQWSTGAGGQLDRRFVNLTLMLDRGLEAEGDRLVPDTSHRSGGRYDELAELLAVHADVPAWVLVGDPGSGKSTVLQHHELTTSACALQALADSTTNSPGTEVCIWQRLSEYSVASPPPAQWLAERWAAQQPGLPALPALQRQVRVRFLLDGLNEIKAPDREGQLAAIERWAQWVAQTTGQGAPPLFSVRTLDQSPLGSAGLEVRQITLAPWTPGQMQGYCAAVLGDGNALWPAIEGDANQLSLCGLPFNLNLQCELFAQLQRPANSRAELFSGMFWLRLRRQHADAALQVPWLLNADDRQRLAGDQWKKAIYALPSQGCLVPWLDTTAERMHRDGREVSVPRPELLQRLQALRDAAPGSAAVEPAAWLHAVQGLGLIGEGGIDPYSGEPSLRFTHQLWQEFFAGRSLRGLPARPPAERPDLQPPPLMALEQVLPGLGKSEPLPRPDPSHWEEAVKLGVQLNRDPLPWLRLLQPLHLALAGRAAVPRRATLEQDAPGRQLLADLRAALLQRSRDAATDLRLRIEAAEALGPLGDPRYQQGRGSEGQRYLLPRREHWVPIPAGRYVIGSETSGQADEQPPTPVDLAAFEVAFAPVTNAEFACFVQANGYEDERWWLGDAAQRWWRGELRNDALIEEWIQRHVDLQHDFDATIRDYPNITEASVENLRRIADLPEADASALFEQWYGAAEYREPLEWRNPRYNQPLQPVVGICLFEAQAYLAWLAAQTGQPLALPTEAQWEAAARGAEGREWPWGTGEPGAWQINADPAHLRRTNPVGVFPEGDGAQGLVDLAGNVWEWTLSAYTQRVDAHSLVTAADDGAALRAVRGGSWVDHADGCRAGFRDGRAPGLRSDGLGFRVVCCPIPGP